MSVSISAKTIGHVVEPAIGQGIPDGIDSFVYVDISSIDYKRKQIEGAKQIETLSAPSRARQRLMPGDVLVSMTRPNLNAVAHVSEELAGAIGSTGFCVLRPKDVDSRWLFYRVQAFDFIHAMDALVQGALYPAVRRNDVYGFPIDPPSINEQRIIVAEIETQFARLDGAVAALQRARTRLKRYRASVLKAACEGKLIPTEAALARQEGREFEPASVLLERIRAEREAAPGKKRGSRSGPRVAMETTPMSDLPGLPEGWAWTTLADIASLKGGITKGNKRKGAEKLRMVPYLRVANVQRGYLDLDEIKYIEATDSEIGDLKLMPGDVLFNEGGDRDKLGRGWVWSGEIGECIHQNHVFRARITCNVIHPKLLSWYGNTHGQEYFVSQGKQTTNLASINLTKLGMLPVPVPPSDEQQRIVAEVERVTSVIDQMEATVETNLRRAGSLRQAVLRMAFSGRLVGEARADTAAGG